VLIEAGIDPAEADRRAENVIIAVEGALVMCRGSGRTEPFRRVLEGIVPALLEGRRARVA
jgi:hypothetical protein